MKNHYDKLVFLDKDKEKEWNAQPQQYKDFCMKNLKQTADKMENKIAIEMLCHIINELNDRVCRLEEGKS